MKKKTTEKKAFREWRIYSFLCSTCGKTARSYKRSRARKELCRPCRSFKVDDRQGSLFMGYDPGTPDGDRAILVMGQRQDDGSVLLARVEEAKLATEVQPDGSIRYGVKVSGTVV